MLLTDRCLYKALILLLTCSFVISPGMSCADTGKQHLIMVTEVWPPYRMKVEGAAGFRGIDIDITNALSKRLGIPIEIQARPWARALEMIKSGQADLITGVAYNEERAEFLDYLSPAYSAVRPVFYTRKGKGAGIGTYEDLYGLSIGYSLHSSYFARFDNDTRLKKVGLAKELQLLEVLSLGRLDAIVGTDPNLSYDISIHNYTDKMEQTAYRPSDKTDLYFALSRKSSHPLHRDDIEQAFQSLIDDGTITRILARYGDR